MNKCIIIGNLTSDPELRQTQSGKSVVKFTVAVNNGKDSDGKDRPADFITCQAWEKRGEAIGRFFKKGSPICVTGAFKTDKYTDKNHEDVTHYNSYILVNEFEFIGKKSDGGGQQTTQATPAQTATEQMTPVESPTGEDVPF